MDDVNKVFFLTAPIISWEPEKPQELSHGYPVL
jgi:hypothetical protein